MNTSNPRREPPAHADRWAVDEHEHRAQLDALLALTGPTDTILDIGSGDGRLAIPLADSGRRIIALDHDAGALAALPTSARLIPHHTDALDASRALLPSDASIACIDAAICMGHTFMLFHDVRAARALLTRVRDLLAPGGRVIIDHFPLALWPEVAEGYWVTGLSEDGAQQLIWAEADNVFALRDGDAVAPEDWTISAGDTLHRLWSMGELTLLAEASGYAEPRPDSSGVLLVFTSR